jgi:hypothetical protein
MIETNVSIIRIKQLVQESLSEATPRDETPENCNTGFIFKHVMIEAVSPLSFLVFVSISVYFSTSFHTNQMINLTLLIVGGLLLPITLHLFPILMFNKVMRHQNDQFKGVRAFNWLLFLSICLGGGYVGYTTITHHMHPT